MKTQQFSTESDGSLVVRGQIVYSPTAEFTREEIRLAAAAPKLLEVLKLCVNAGALPWIEQDALTAIASAEGRP
jgi:hypothetical protein